MRGQLHYQATIKNKKRVLNLEPLEDRTLPGTILPFLTDAMASLDSVGKSISLVQQKTGLSTSPEHKSLQLSRTENRSLLHRSSDVTRVNSKWITNSARHSISGKLADSAFSQRIALENLPSDLMSQKNTFHSDQKAWNTAMGSTRMPDTISDWNNTVIRSNDL